MPINKAWHLENKMPKNATIEQRITWHQEHMKHCDCRKGMPGKLKTQMLKKTK